MQKRKKYKLLLLKRFPNKLDFGNFHQCVICVKIIFCWHKTNWDKQPFIFLFFYFSLSEFLYLHANAWTSVFPVRINTSKNSWFDPHRNNIIAAIINNTTEHAIACSNDHCTVLERVHLAKWDTTQTMNLSINGSNLLDTLTQKGDQNLTIQDTNGTYVMNTSFKHKKKLIWTKPVKDYSSWLSMNWTYCDMNKIRQDTLLGLCVCLCVCVCVCGRDLGGALLTAIAEAARPARSLGSLR